LLGNLVTNAIHYGTRDTPVRVAVAGDGTDVRIEVSNMLQERGSQRESLCIAYRE